MRIRHLTPSPRQRRRPGAVKGQASGRSWSWRRHSSG